MPRVLGLGHVHTPVSPAPLLISSLVACIMMSLVFFVGKSETGFSNMHRVPRQRPTDSPTVTGAPRTARPMLLGYLHTMCWALEVRLLLFVLYACSSGHPCLGAWLLQPFCLAALPTC